MERGRNCSSRAISPPFHNILLPDVDFYVKTSIRFSLQDKRLFEIIEVEIKWVDCICLSKSEVSVERSSVCNAIKKFAEYGIHCLLFLWIFLVVSATPSIAVAILEMHFDHKSKQSQKSCFSF